jgi:hypothetical protein
MKCYWAQFRNILGNTLGTLGELNENTTDKQSKNSPSPPPQTEKKKIKPLQRSNWLHEISISKMVHHHFQPRLIPPL